MRLDKIYDSVFPQFAFWLRLTFNNQLTEQKHSNRAAEIIAKSSEEASPSPLPGNFWGYGSQPLTQSLTAVYLHRMVCKPSTNYGLSLLYINRVRDAEFPLAWYKICLRVINDNVILWAFPQNCFLNELKITQSTNCYRFYFYCFCWVSLCLKHFSFNHSFIFFYGVHAIPNFCGSFQSLGSFAVHFRIICGSGSFKVLYNTFIDSKSNLELWICIFLAHFDF